MNDQINWTVYLSGEIHTDWREQIEAGAKALNLPVNFTSAVTNHEASDEAGDHLMENDNSFESLGAPLVDSLSPEDQQASCIQKQVTHPQTHDS